MIGIAVRTDGKQQKQRDNEVNAMIVEENVHEAPRLILAAMQARTAPNSGVPDELRRKQKGQFTVTHCQPKTSYMQ